MADQTILHLLHRNAQQSPSAAAYYEKSNGAWNPTGWADYLSQVRQAARALIALGLEEGDVVTILGFNRSEWVIADLAAMLMGGVAAGIYTSNAPAEVQYIVDHAQSKLIVLEDAGQYAKIVAERANMPALQYCVMMKGAEVANDDGVMSWEQFMAKGDSVADSEIDNRLNKLRADQLSTLIYTSGTTGPPKGVMLSHNNLVWTAKTSVDMIGATPGDSSLSYLPLSHIAEQMFTIHGPMTAGYPIYFAEGPLQIADNLKEVRPTIVFGVPRVWERFYNGLQARLAEAEGTRAKLVAWARDVAFKVSLMKNDGKQPSGLLALQYRIAQRLVLSKVHAALGMDRARVMVSGAAPIPKQILEFMASLDMRILEVYGQSEDCGPTSFNRLDRTRFGSVGPALDGVEVKLTNDQEIIVKGPNVFLGYYKNESATEKTLIDGWLYSGDLGRFDSDGYLYITGRIKDIIITSGGKNIAPKNLEAAMTSMELISSAVCIGEQQRYLVGLLTLEPEAAERFASENGMKVEDLYGSDVLQERLKADIAKEVNEHFARVEQIRNFVVLPRDFSVETGELTPTFKIKRAVVNKMYADEIQACYDAGQIL